MIVLGLAALAGIFVAATALIASTVPSDSETNPAGLALCGLFFLGLAALVPRQWRRPSGLIALEAHVGAPRVVGRFLLRGLFPIATAFVLAWIAMMLDAYGVDFTTTKGRAFFAGVGGVVAVWLLASGLFRRPRILMPYEYRVDQDPNGVR
jgi:hypothetical protein